jgi:hypothetical protein
MKKLNILIAAIAIASLSISSVFAGTWGMGVTASMLNVEGSGSETDRLTLAGADVTDTSVRKKTTDETTATGSLFGEFTTDTRFPISLGFEYTPGTANFSDKLSRTDTETSQTGQEATTAISNTRSAEADATNFSTAYVELTLVGPLYVRAGVSHMDIDYTTKSGTGGGSYTDSISLGGTNIGIGLKGVAGTNTTWKLAYEQTDYDGFSLRSTGNSLAANSNAIKGDVDTNALRFSLGKQF